MPAEFRNWTARLTLQGQRHFTPSNITGWLQRFSPLFERQDGLRVRIMVLRFARTRYAAWRSKFYPERMPVCRFVALNSSYNVFELFRTEPLPAPRRDGEYLRPGRHVQTIERHPLAFFTVLVRPLLLKLGLAPGEKKGAPAHRWMGRRAVEESRIGGAFT